MRKETGKLDWPSHQDSCVKKTGHIASYSEVIKKHKQNTRLCNLLQCVQDFWNESKVSKNHKYEIAIYNP